MNFKELQDLSLAFVPQGKGSAVSEVGGTVKNSADQKKVSFGLLNF